MRPFGLRCYPGDHKIVAIANNNATVHVQSRWFKPKKQDYAVMVGHIPQPGYSPIPQPTDKVLIIQLCAQIKLLIWPLFFIAE